MIIYYAIFKNNFWLYFSIIDALKFLHSINILFIIRFLYPIFLFQQISFLPGLSRTLYNLPVLLCKK
jgi:myosin-crossreactive antigen